MIHLAVDPLATGQPCGHPASSGSTTIGHACALGAATLAWRDTELRGQRTFELYVESTGVFVTGRSFALPFDEPEIEITRLVMAVAHHK